MILLLMYNEYFLLCEVLVGSLKKDRGDEPGSWTHIIFNASQVILGALVSFWVSTNHPGQSMQGEKNTYDTQEYKASLIIK